MTTKGPEQKLDVRYGQQPALYTSQFMINAGAEEVALDCMSGVEANAAGDMVAPVHTKLAMSWAAAQRLATLLNQALERRPTSSGPPIPAPHIRMNAAKLPSFGEANV